MLYHKGKGDERSSDNYCEPVSKTIRAKVVTAALACRFEAMPERNGLHSPSRNGFRSTQHHRTASKTQSLRGENLARHTDDRPEGRA